MGTFGAGVFGGPGGDADTSSTLGTPFKVLLRAMLRKAGVTLAPGRGPSTDQYAEAIGEVNRMIGGWNTNPLMIFTKRIDVWETALSKKTYTLGPGGDWDGPRPQKITYANLFLPTDGVIRRKIRVLDDGDWQQIRYQDIFTYPKHLYCDGSIDNGQVTVYLHPAPNAVYPIELYTWQAIPTFATLEDVVLLPPGYEDAIVNNGAVRLASMPWPHQRQMDPQVRIDAVASLRTLRQFNASAPHMRTDGDLRNGYGTYNYLTGLED